MIADINHPAYLTFRIREYVRNDWRLGFAKLKVDSVELVKAPVRESAGEALLLTAQDMDHKRRGDADGFRLYDSRCRQIRS